VRQKLLDAGMDAEMNGVMARALAGAFVFAWGCWLGREGCFGSQGCETTWRA
jgi:hypothetical protein